MITEKNPPTLWPLHLNDETRMKLAYECLEKENMGLKEIVVCLSETILRNIVTPKRHVGLMTGQVPCPAPSLMMMVLRQMPPPQAVAIDLGQDRRRHP